LNAANNAVEEGVEATNKEENNNPVKAAEEPSEEVVPN
jgi:hypothetical protein